MFNLNSIKKIITHLTLVIGLSTPGLIQAGAGITIVNADGASEGFNDATVVESIGGNTGTTLGAQRLNAFQYAANIWAAILNNTVEIKVEAKFDPLSCGLDWAVLGSAGTTTVHRDFTPKLGATVVPNTWYHQALANQLHGSDLSSSYPDMSATFNSSIGGATCLSGMGWYLGLDGNNVTDIDLVAVLIHEIAHGIGFSTFVNESTGAKFFNKNDIFMRTLEDHSKNKLWPSMTNNQRKTSAIDTGDLHGVGNNVVGANSNQHVKMYAPNPVQPGSSVSHFDTSLTPDQSMEPFITDPPIHDPGLAVPLMHDLGW